MKTFVAIGLIFLAKTAFATVCCPWPMPQQNGFPNCDSKNALGSTCHFECYPGFELIGETSTTTCVLDSDNKTNWSNPPSIICDSLESPCPDLGEEFFVGEPMETDSGSEIPVTCVNEALQVLPSSVTTLPCSDEGRSLAKRLCCAETSYCNETRKADIVFAIDSSISFGKDNFRLVKDLVRDYIDSFSLQESVTRFSVFQYSNDTDSEILLRDSVVDRQELFDAFGNLPNTLNEGRSTGRALNHINDVILQEANGDRLDVANYVFLFTGPSSDDDVVAAANKLRAKENTQVYVVGWDAENMLDAKHFLAIAGGDRERFVEADASTTGTSVFGDIEESVCRVHC